MTRTNRRLHRPRSLLAAAVVTLALGLALGPVGPAGAAFPGANGRIVFASDIRGSWQVYSMPNDGTGLRRLTNLPDTGSADLMPSASPDGSKIVFVSDMSGNPELYLMNADGSGMTQLTDDPGYDDVKPSWSPDGGTIAFARCTPDAGCGIYTIGANGGGMTKVTPVSSSDFGPVYTPDGARIVFESQRQGLISAVWIMNADGTGKVRLTPAKLMAGGPDVSPDGEHIVFFSHENFPPPSSIYVMNIDGSGVTRLTRARDGHSDLWPSYSPDGKWIALSTNRAYPGLCCYEVWRMKATGANLTPLTSNLTISGCENGNCVYPDWAAKPSA
jgi:Tol biopolymer transport system component